ncbi:MAG TPA: type II toxin-antitoxin system PemK/MazF family toxin [Rhizomicrobium sp.]|jgi:mRNA interferase MazF|nr:type II toxin-antitoxin system PemK/MazF family toxin [Rhizomicrobium sp.]
MKRGDIVTVATQGDYGKPRPAVVIQSDRLDGTDSILVCLVTSTVRAAPLFRLDVPGSVATGLRVPSQVMADKIMAVRRDKCGPAIGRLDATTLVSLSRMLALLTGITD